MYFSIVFEMATANKLRIVLRWRGGTSCLTVSTT